MIGNYGKPPRGYVYIYKLVNNRTGSVFYVGKTKQSLRRRLREHMGRYRRFWNCGYAEVDWSIHLIVTVRACNARRCERRWIREYGRKSPLKNRAYNGGNSR